MLSRTLSIYLYRILLHDLSLSFVERDRGATFNYYDSKHFNVHFNVHIYFSIDMKKFVIRLI